MHCSLGEFWLHFGSEGKWKLFELKKQSGHLHVKGISTMGSRAGSTLFDVNHNGQLIKKNLLSYSLSRQGEICKEFLRKRVFF